ncbi:MAG: hypothetical protein Ct9H300mP27_10120 [Chloroflexota bacterium]|nr:MAG: hypothetical protein Ct9H300mP27_10120 [Chloroflexota bacterium]
MTIFLKSQAAHVRFMDLLSKLQVLVDWKLFRKWRSMAATTLGRLVGSTSNPRNYVFALLVITIGAINTLPSLFVSPWGGVLGDRLDRRKLVMSLQLFMTCMAFFFAFLILLDLG